MLKWAILFFIASLIAGYLGYTNVAIAAADIAKILFYVFVLLFLLAIALLLLGK